MGQNNSKKTKRSNHLIKYTTNLKITWQIWEIIFISYNAHWIWLQFLQSNIPREPTKNGLLPMVRGVSSYLATQGSNLGNHCPSPEGCHTSKKVYFPHLNQGILRSLEGWGPNPTMLGNKKQDKRAHELIQTIFSLPTKQGSHLGDWLRWFASFRGEIRRMKWGAVKGMDNGWIDRFWRIR